MIVFPFRSNNYILNLGFNIIQFVVVVLISSNIWANLFHDTKQSAREALGYLVVPNALQDVTIIMEVALEIIWGLASGEIKNIG